MKKIMWHWFVSLTFSLFFVFSSPFILSCSSEEDAQPVEEPNEEEEEPEELDINEYYVSNLLVRDISNTGTAEDLLISFNGAIKSDSISEYRIIIIKNTIANQLTVSSAINLDNDNFLTVPNDKTTFEINLSSSQLDFSGDAIAEDVEYRIAVLSIGVHLGTEVNALSSLSEKIIIDYDAMVSTLVPNLDGNDAVTIDDEGNIYVSNFGTYTSSGGTGTHVLKITPDGTSSVFVDGLSGPLGGAFDSEGNFYVINANNGTKGEILKISPDGEKTSLAEIDGWPAGIVIDVDENLFISNYSSPNIHKYSNTSELSVCATDESLSGCVGIVLDEDGNIVTGNYDNGKIIKVDGDGDVSLITQITGLPNQFALGYIAIADQKIYATGIGNNKIYEVSLDGEYSVFAGNGTSASTDGPLLEASFKGPNGIGVDEINNKIYVVDWGSKKLRVIELGE